MNLHLITALLLLPHGALNDKPILLQRYTNLPACARDAPLVQMVARSKWANAIALCRESHAPYYSVRPRHDPRE